MTGPAVIRVVVADDNPVLRLGVRAALSGTDQVAVVGEAADGPSALALARGLRPDVVLLDVRMPGGDGPPVVAAISRLARVVMLTGSDDPDIVAAVIGAGATSYLVHGSYGTSELVDVVVGAACGRPHASPAAAAALVHAVRNGTVLAPPGSRSGSELSVREREVMCLVADGLSNEDIGDQLGLTEKTVKNHLQHAYDKLGVHSRAGALSAWIGVGGSLSGVQSWVFDGDARLCRGVDGEE